MVTINPEDYAAAQKFHYKPNGKAVLIPGVGVDVKGIKAMRTEKDIIRRELNIPEDAFAMYSIGELIPRKNHIFVLETLEETFRSHPDLHYFIAGNGALTDELTQWIREHNLTGQIHLLGFRKDARRLMYGMDLFLFPSKQEGLPVAVIEAMAAGLPVIASDIRGSHDLIRNEENGMLYPVTDAAGFLAAFQKLYASPALRQKLGRQASLDADAYSLEEVEPKILALYH